MYLFSFTLGQPHQLLRTYAINFAWPEYNLYQCYCNFILISQLIQQSITCIKDCMSTEPPAQNAAQNVAQNQLNNQVGQSSSKPITAAFDLETKIRVIIQQVLAATMRKISQFNQKVQTFQKFFFTYTQRIGDIEEKGKVNEQTLARLFDTVTKNKQNTQNQIIKVDQKIQMLRLQKNQLAQDVRQINKKITTINRQNETINNQFSNTKKKFLEFSEQMTTLKQQVAWKITRYVQQTAQINTKIQINNQQIKKQYFNINLALEKNKQKYEEIISTKDQQDSFNQRFKEMLQSVEENLHQKGEAIGVLNKKLDDMDTALYSKIKLTQSKLERKIEDLSQNNTRIQQSVSKVDGFSKLLEQIRDDSQKTRRQLLKKFEETDQKHTDRIDKQVLALNMNFLNYQKGTDKKIKGLSQTQQKASDLFNQKMQYLKIQIQTQISSKATRMLQEKSKTQSGISNSAMQQLQQSINKLSLQTKKEVNKMENTVKDLKLQVKHQMEDIKQTVETRITTTVKAIEQSQGSGVSPQFVQSINQRIQSVSDVCDLKLSEFSKQISEQNLRIMKVQDIKSQTEEKFQQLMQQNIKNFGDLDQKLSNKVQRVLYTVTKMRGDAIIRNQFTDKQIKQLKRVTDSTQKQISTVIKLFPAIGECINLVMCLIYDAEFQHAKIIQDNLPTQKKDTIKFQNLVQGILYEYPQKKKPGFIIYRHKQQKKIDIVRATFVSYMQIWEQLFGNDFKNKQQYIPKTFYRKYIQKNIGKTSRNDSPSKQQSQPTNLQQLNSRQFDVSKQLIGQAGSQNNIKAGTESSQNMNKSFHIRKKKVSTIRTRDDLIMVVQENLKEQK